MTDEAALEALDWLEAHRGKPVTGAWYAERDAKILVAVPPKPAQLERGREGRWLVVYGNGMTRILNRGEFALFTVVVDKQRLVIDYGRRHGNRRFVLEASEVC
jgi:hypothetical protein